MKLNNFERENGTYRADLYCKNCGAKSNVEIQWGVPIWEYVKGKSCEQCGCKTLGRDMSEEVK